MKKLAAILCLSALTTGAFAQGTVSFANGVSTLISYSPTGTAQTLPASPVGSYYFGLLIGSAAAGPFTFSGVIATNTAAGSKLGPPTYTPVVNGWTAQTSMFFEVAGWSASLGTTFKSGWLVNNAPAAPNAPVWGGNGFFGLSNVGSGTSGGGVTPPLPVFGGTGVSGFDLSPVGVPEPTSMALAGLGAAALLIFRRRK
jgi:hypothetical protein